MKKQRFLRILLIATMLFMVSPISNLHAGDCDERDNVQGGASLTGEHQKPPGSQDYYMCRVSSSEAKISPRTRQMSLNETQPFSVEGADGRDASCFSWSIESASENPGTLSVATGFSTVYSAPSNNPYCNNNPTITLKCGGKVVDNLTIAVSNPATANWVAYTKTESTCKDMWGEWSCNCSRWRCNGSYHYWGGACDDRFRSEGACQESQVCGGPVGTIWDARTDYVKSQGCCPAALVGK